MRSGKTVRRDPKQNQQAWKNSSHKAHRVALKGGSLKQGSKRVNENYSGKYVDDYDEEEEYFEDEEEQNTEEGEV